MEFIISAISFALAIFSIMYGVVVITYIKFNAKRYQQQKNIKTSNSFTIILVGCSLYNFGTYTELNDLNIIADDHLQVLSPILTTLSYIGRLLFISELTIYPHKLANNMDGALIKAPFSGLISKIGLTNYYRFCFFVNAILTGIVIVCRILSITISLVQLDIVHSIIVTIDYVYNVFFQIIGLNAMKRMLTKFDKKTRVLQLTLLSFTVANMFLSILTSIFITYTNNCQNCALSVMLINKIIRILARIVIWGIACVVTLLMRQIFLLYAKFQLYNLKIKVI